MEQFEPNRIFKTFQQKAHAARSALRATRFGQGGIIEIVRDGDNVKFKIPALSFETTSIGQAMQKAAGLGITESFTFKPPKSGLSESVVRGSSINSPAAIYDNVYNKSQFSRLSAADKKLLQEAGIDPRELKSLQASFYTMRSKQKDLGKVAQNILDLRRDGKLDGIVIMDDEGARIINFKVNGRSLNAYQSNLLMTITGSSRLDPDEFGMILGNPNAKEAVRKLGDKLGKLPKRERSYLSKRPFAASGTELATYLSAEGLSSDLVERSLILDPQYDLLRLYSATGAADELSDLSAGALSFYKTARPMNYFGRILKAAPDLVGDEFEDEFKKAIREFKSTGKGWKSDELMKHLEARFEGQADKLNIIKSIFSSIEYGFDGSDLLNSKYVTAYRDKALREEVEKLDDVIRTATSTSKREAAVLRKAEIESLIENLKDIRDLQQITGRGYLPGFGSIKTAFEVKLFKRELSEYAMIISKFGLKNETRTKSVAELILSGMGSARQEVYVDPLLVAYNQAQLTSPDVIEGMKINSRQVLKEYQGIIESGSIPERILRQLRLDAAQEIDGLPFYLRESAMRNREYARDLIELIDSGATVRDTPRLANMLHGYYATRAFRRKGEAVQLILPNVNRLAIDTEASLGAARGEKQILGEGFEQIAGMKFGSKTIDINQDIVKFRVIGHKMYFAPQVVGEVRHALGGFDLDDKVLEMLRLYQDENGIDRLGFSLFRQPTGSEERMFLRSSFDADTIQSIFGRVGFNETLDEMMELPLFMVGGEKLSDKKFAAVSTLSRIMNSKRPGAVSTTDDEMELAITTVLRAMEERGRLRVSRLTEEEAAKVAKYGSSSLSITAAMMRGQALEDIVPGYTSSKVHMIITKPDVFDMSQELRGVVETANVKKTVKLALLNAKTFEDMVRILGNDFANDKRAQSLLATAFGEAQLKRAAQAGGSLGTYMNRSAVISSIMDQYEEMFSSIGDSRVRNFLAKNYNIGLVATESAVDLAVNFSGTRLLDEEVTRRIGASVGVNEAGLAEAIEKLMGRGRLAPAGRAITADLLGEIGISDLGKLIGFSTGLSAADDSVLKLGLDAFLFRDRLKKDDIPRFMEGIITGLTDYRSNFAKPEEDEALGEMIREMMDIHKKKNAEEMRTFLIEKIGLGSDSKYGGSFRLQEEGLLMEEMFGTTNRLSLSAIRKNEALMFAQVENGSAEGIARSIIDDNMEFFDQIGEIHKRGIRELAEEEKAYNKLLLAAAGDSVFGQMQKALDSGLSMRDLVISMDRYNAGTRRDITELGATTEAQQQMIEDARKVRRMMNVEYFERFGRETAEEYVSELAAGRTGLTMDEIKNIASERITKESDPTLREAIDRVLAGETDSIKDEMLRREAQMQANIIKAMADREEMADDFERLGAGADSISVPVGMEDDEEIKRMVRIANEVEDDIPITKTKYKRFVKDEFIDLFKNDKILKRSALAVAALAVGSFVYSGIRDRTHDDVTGPPLLPGGNPYEQGYPTRQPQVPEMAGQGYAPGMSYQVSLQGGRGDVERFNAAAGGLVNGNLSTTMYNSIPSVSKDPYQRMGQAY